ncbi:MAG: polyketide cyclase/dehydrase [Symbiobacteriaceae bacterium]|jgi:ribosome-associated toxin RatA of RatAB toxin-antitoxin module|nr:polyketide cyclase/dehydrase [Symbiobacteriaceae bacterium]
MMKTENVAWFSCPPAAAFGLACGVERWPSLLPHYRWVRRHAGDLVEMAARRDFGRFSWPVWWLSRMTIDPAALVIHYTHVAGITRGMEVWWRLEPSGNGTRVSIIHEWEGGPAFAGPAARAVGRRIVGPLFVEAIAAQTLNHLAAHAKGRTQTWSGAGQ